MTGRKRLPDGYVQIRNSGAAFHITLPALIGRQIGTEAMFHVELVEEGILLRYIPNVDEHANPSLPTWVSDLRSPK